MILSIIIISMIINSTLYYYWSNAWCDILLNCVLNMQYKMAGRVLRGVDSLHYQCTNNEVVTRAVHSEGDDTVDSKLKAVKVHGLTSLDAWIHTGKESNFYLSSSFSPRFMQKYKIYE